MPSEQLSRRRLLQSAGLAAAAGTLAPVAARGEVAARPARPAFGLGLVTYNIAKDWDLATTLRICSAVGIEAVELRTTHRHGVEPDLSPAQRAEVRRQFEDAGVVCWGCGTTCEFHSPDPAVVRSQIETCLRFIELTRDIGGRGVKVRPNGLPKEVPAEQTLAQIGDALRECGAAAAEAGVEIWLEVHGAETSQPEHCRTMMERCGHPAVGLTWNSNGTDVRDGSVAAAFEMLAPWIRSCHINDLYRDAAGGYPYRELFRLLRETGYDRYTLIEVGRTPPDEASGEELLRYYRALWLELNRV
ncbi:MAG: sugar phosphate isomerase/epimerase [Planctomyces sp.]|nr:sugar phosphate isomerase/epimerase [Planctomyces sp.]